MTSKCLPKVNTLKTGSDIIQLSQENISTSCSSIWDTNGSLCTNICPPHRCFHGLHQWDPVSDGNQCNRSYFCFLPRKTPVSPRRLHRSSELRSLWPHDLPSIVYRCAHSGSKYHKFLQMQLMQHRLPQLVWEHLFICSVLGLMTHFLPFTGRSNLYLTAFSSVFLVCAVIQK